MLESETKISQIVVRCVGRQGETIWLEDNFIAYKKNKENGSDKIIAYTANITSRCEKEVQIRQLEERNRKIIEALPEFIFIFDDNFYYGCIDGTRYRVVASGGSVNRSRWAIYLFF